VFRGNPQRVLDPLDTLTVAPRKAEEVLSRPTSNGRPMNLFEDFRKAMTPTRSQPTGLCASCAHARAVSTPRSEFLLCERSKHDARFERYPRLPVLACPGYEPSGHEKAPAAKVPDRGPKG
jgi:hypothetical protein